MPRIDFEGSYPAEAHRQMKVGVLSPQKRNDRSSCGSNWDIQQNIEFPMARLRNCTFEFSRFTEKY